MENKAGTPDTDKPEDVFSDGAKLMAEIGLLSVPLSQSKLKPSDMIVRLDALKERLEKISRKT